MSSQSAPHRTAHGAYMPVKPSPESHKVNDWDAPVSWWWLPGIIAGAYILFAYVVPFSANLLVELFH